MSTSSHPIIILSDSDVEDAFSSTNTPDYSPASSNYSPASPGNTSSDPLKNSSKDRLASLSISPFYDDPYMKVMQAYNATSNELPIPPSRAPIAPPTVLPPSLVLPPSPLFDPRDFFLPEEILLPRKRACFLSSSSTDSSAPPYVFEIRVAGFQRKQIGHDDEIVLARVRISILEMLIEDIQIYVCRSCLSYILYFDVSCLNVSGITMVLLPSGFLEPLCPGIIDMINNQDIELMIPSTPPRDIEPPIGSPISLSSSSSVGSSSPVRSTTPPPDYPFDESIFAELDNSMTPKRTSTSTAPAMTQAAIKKLVTDSVAAALEA
ncbi:hypothetical protein Tco_0109909 [Tanacetum coccineum]